MDYLFYDFISLEKTNKAGKYKKDKYIFVISTIFYFRHKIVVIQFIDWIFMNTIKKYG